MMRIKNTNRNYGWVSIALHWGMAIAIVCMFALGYWMVGLSYYDEWYRVAPWLHKSVGVLLAMLLVARWLWRCANKKPAVVETMQAWEKWLAHGVHYLFYLLLLALVVSGYLISTADGRGIDVFNWFELPGMGELFANQAYDAGWVHEYLAYTVIGLAVFHALAALKHHFINRDNTLRKMLGRSPEEKQ